MTTVENNLIVNIFGEEYPLSGVADPTHVTRVAQYVDTKMREAARSGRVQARDKVAILAALSMASELLEKSDLIDFVEKEAERVLDHIIADLERVLAENSSRA